MTATPLPVWSPGFSRRTVEMERAWQLGTALAFGAPAA